MFMCSIFRLLMILIATSRGIYAKKKSFEEAFCPVRVCSAIFTYMFRWAARFMVPCQRYPPPGCWRSASQDISDCCVQALKASQKNASAL